MIDATGDEVRRILRWPEVRLRTGLSASAIKALERSGEFPMRIKLSKRAIGWDDLAINDWLDDRIALSEVRAAEAAAGRRRAKH